MSTPRWYLPTVSEIIALSEQPEPGVVLGADDGAVAGGHARDMGNPVEETPRDRPRSLARRRARAEREWYGAVGAVNDLLRSLLKVKTADSPSLQGVVLSGSAPILEESDMLSQFSAWTFVPGTPSDICRIPFHLLPASCDLNVARPTPEPIPLAADDPLATEQFCVVLTSTFSMAMSLGTDADGVPVFLFSFAPNVVWKAWRILQSRLQMTQLPVLQSLGSLVEQFPPVEPHYRTVTQFQRFMLSHLSDALDGRVAVGEGGRSRRRARLQRLNTAIHALNSEGTGGITPSPNLNSPANTKLDPTVWDGVVNKSQRPKRSAARPAAISAAGSEPSAPPKSSLDVELLQAIAHEVRTPLTTIRTLTRLLLRRKDLHPDAVKRLKMIDGECTEQIDRFNLIFRAVELETQSAKTAQTPLAAISLDQLFEQSIPRWQTQARQHSLTLDVSLPQKLPMVVSDPTMLEQVLTGLIDRITHTLPGGSHIQIEVTLAGHQLKLQFQAESQDTNHSSDFISGLSSYFAPTLKSIGDLLMFQPETGNLSLNLAVTKNLFQALGGKLTVRHRPQQGEILTIFLPLQD